MLNIKSLVYNFKLRGISNVVTSFLVASPTYIFENGRITRRMSVKVNANQFIWIGECYDVP